MPIDGDKSFESARPIDDAALGRDSVLDVYLNPQAPDPLWNFDKNISLYNHAAYLAHADLLAAHGYDLTRQHLPEGDPATQVACVTIRPNVERTDLSVMEQHELLMQARKILVDYQEAWLRELHCGNPAAIRATDVKLFYTEKYPHEFTIVTTRPMSEVTEHIFLISDKLRVLPRQASIAVLSNELCLTQGLNLEQRRMLLSEYLTHAEEQDAQMDLETQILDLPHVYGTDLETVAWLVDMLPAAYIPEPRWSGDQFRSIKNEMITKLYAELEKPHNPAAHRSQVGDDTNMPHGFETWRLDIVEQARLRYALIELMNRTANQNYKFSQTG